MTSDLPIVQNRLSCDDCGACCMGAGMPMFQRESSDGVSRAERHYVELPRNLRREVDEYYLGIRKANFDQPCVWLDLNTMRCKHYEHRPQACRDYEVGSAACLRSRWDRGIEMP